MFNVEVLVRREVFLATSEEYIPPERLGKTSLKIHPSTGSGDVRYHELSPPASFRFTQALYDDKDPYKRHQRFYWNGVLSGMGNRTFVRNPVSQQHGYRMNMVSKDEAMPAFPAARLIVRADLAQPGREIDRAILYWERETKQGR